MSDGMYHAGLVRAPPHRAHSAPVQFAQKQAKPPGSGAEKRSPNQVCSSPRHKALFRTANGVRGVVLDTSSHVGPLHGRPPPPQQSPSPPPPLFSLSVCCPPNPFGSFSPAPLLLPPLSLLLCPALCSLFPTEPARHVLSFKHFQLHSILLRTRTRRTFHRFLRCSTALVATSGPPSPRVNVVETDSPR